MQNHGGKMRFVLFVFAISCTKKETTEKDYQQGYDEGYNEGTEAGQAQGQQQGFDSGYEEGFEAGFEDGYEDGLGDGFDSGYEEGLEDGYEDGYEDGLGSTVDAGWDLYAAGEYADACSSFFHEAYENGFDQNVAVGLGWCHLRQAETLLAASWFELAVAIDPTSQDGWVGLSSSAMLMHDFQLSSHAIDQALLLDPNYSCSFEAIDADSLRVAQVLNLLFDQDPVGASIVLTELEPVPILPLDATTWTIDGTAYHSFQRAVIAKLQQLGGI